MQRIGKGQTDAGASGERRKLQAAPAGTGMPGHTGSTPEFRPNHDEAESGAHTGSEIKRKLQAAPARAGKPGHTGITPEFHPNHGEAESGTHTGSEINRKRTIFRTNS